MRNGPFIFPPESEGNYSNKHLDQGCQQSPFPFQVHVPGLMGWALYTVIILLCMKAGVDFAVLKGLRSIDHLLDQEKNAM